MAVFARAIRLSICHLNAFGTDDSTLSVRGRLDLAGRIQAEPNERGAVLKDVSGPAAEALAEEVDNLFQVAVTNLQSVAPNFKVISLLRSPSTYLLSSQNLAATIITYLMPPRLLMSPHYKAQYLRHSIREGGAHTLSEPYHVYALFLAPNEADILQ